MAWNVSFERQLTSDMSFQMAYVGTAGSHLYHDFQLNQCNPPSFTIATPPPSYPACLPFYSINPNITTVDSRNSTGNSHYNAMQLELQKRTARGLTLTAACTWSKMMDNINNPIDSYATRQELDTANWQRNINIFILTIYARRDGRWQQIAWQSTRDTATSPAK